MKLILSLFVALAVFAQVSPNQFTITIPSSKKLVLQAGIQRPPLKGVRIGILAAFGDAVSQNYGAQLYQMIGNFNNSLNVNAERASRPGLWIVGPPKFSGAMTALRTLLSTNGIQVDGVRISSQQFSGDYDIEVQLNR